MTIIPADEYERLVINGLTASGLEPAQARALADGHFPLTGWNILQECQQRGVMLSEADLVCWASGHPVNQIGVNRDQFEEFLTWALANRCARPAFRVIIGIEDMLTGLRSDNPEHRGASAFLLAKSLGAGFRLTGENVEDVQHILAPASGALLERARDGDGAAVDELQRLITTDPSKAFHKGARMIQREPA